MRELRLTARRGMPAAVARRVMNLAPMQYVTDLDLRSVTGGADDFGRCGPGSRWRFLGDVYTPACAAHDGAVRGALARGTPRIVAHLQALPLLPAAVGSYVKKRLGY